MNAIEAATWFLLDNQDTDGAWRDFLLKPGRSDAWTTAYIAARLPRTDRESDAVRRATRFLLNARGPEGWSYNRNCPADADTTAHAILFLQSRGLARPADYSALARFQLPCGGFATYKSASRLGGWTQPHPDVTALALRVLSAMLDCGHDIMQRARASLAAHLSGPHGWRSYWWNSRLYLATQLAMLPGYCRLVPPDENGLNNFDQALALELAATRRESSSRIGTLRTTLLSRCSADGSWPSEPMLRITNQQAADFEDPLFALSPVVADDKRLFTTATALGALACSG